MLYTFISKERTNMKEETKLIFKRPNSKSRLPYWISIIFGAIFLLTFLVPYFYTVSSGTRSEIMGYSSLAYLADQQDILYYSVAMFLISLVCSIGLIIAGVIGIFSKEEQLKQIFIGNLILYILKVGFDIAGCALSTSTSTNVKLNWGGYLSPCLSFVLLGVFIAIYINFKDKKEALIKPHEDKATTSK